MQFLAYFCVSWLGFIVVYDKISCFVSFYTSALPFSHYINHIWIHVHYFVKFCSIFLSFLTDLACWALQLVLLVGISWSLRANLVDWCWFIVSSFFILYLPFLTSKMKMNLVLILQWFIVTINQISDSDILHFS